MRIGVVTAYPEPIGFNHGVLHFCRLAKSLDCGLEPIIIAMTRHPFTENPFILKARAMGLQVETLHERFRYDPQVIPSLLKLIDKFGIQLLDAQTYKPLAICVIAQRCRPNLLLASWVHGFTQENFKIRVFGVIEKIMHRFSNKVFCVSKPFAELMVKKGIDNSKIEIVPNGISEEEFECSENSEQLRAELCLDNSSHIIGAIGRLSLEKGHINLIKAWPKICNAVPNCKLLIVGDGPCMSVLLQEVRKLQIDDSVIFAGFRPDGRRFFKLFDVMVLPSICEGLPYVLLEAMAQRTPVVATAVGEVPEVLNNGQLGRLIPPDNINAIAENVIGLLRTPIESRLIIASRAHESVLNRYSQVARTQRISTAYRNMARLT